MEDYKPNSEVSKKEKPKSEKIISGSASASAKPKGRFMDIFMPGDVNNAKDHVVNNVLIPALKKMALDAVNMGLNILMYRNEKIPGSSNYRTPASTVSYNPYNKYSDDDYYVRPSKPVSDRIGYREVRLTDPVDAKDVLMHMDNLIASYGVASMLDLYDLVGLPTQSTDNKYGWMDLRTARIETNRDGTYTIKLPRPLPLD